MNDEAFVYMRKKEAMEILNSLHEYHFLRPKLEKYINSFESTEQQMIGFYELELSEIQKVIGEQHPLWPRFQKAGENIFKW